MISWYSQMSQHTNSVQVITEKLKIWKLADLQTQAKGISKQNPKANIWTEKWMRMGSERRLHNEELNIVRVIKSRRLR